VGVGGQNTCDRRTGEIVWFFPIVIGQVEDSCWALGKSTSVECGVH
jgi:hypothetical protein